MKIAFIFPPFHHRKFSENLKVVDEEFTLSPPIILAYVAAICEKAGHDVILIDAHALKLTKKEVLQRINIFRPDILAFRVETYNFPETLEWIQYLKFSTGLPILVGGINMDLYPLETMSHKEIDFALAGEVINTLPEFLRCLENEKSFTHIPGLYWRENGELRYNLPNFNTVSFDEYPFPARHLLPNEVYHSFVSQRKNFTIMLTQTGCPWRCKFCHISALKKYRKPAYRKRSWENVIKEIEQCYYDYGIREIDIFDATFFIDKERDIKICQEIRKRGMKISWTCRSRVDVVDEDILREAAKAGCRMIFWGIESGSQDVLDAVNKDIKLEQTISAIKIAKKYGIENLGFLMIGNPCDTEETIKNTLKFVKKLGIDHVQICRTIAKPSTQLHEELLKQVGYDYWRDYVLGRVGEERIPTPWCKIPQERIEKLLKKMYYSFYFRPSIVLKRLARLKSLSELIRYIKVGLRMVFHYLYTDVNLKKIKVVEKLAHLKLDETFSKKKVAVVLPVYNEGETVLRLIKKLLSLYPKIKIFVVDSSNDGTQNLLENFSKSYTQINYSYVKKGFNNNERGNAMKYGFKLALSNGADIIVEMDSDYSHDPEDLGKIVSSVHENSVVIGSRYTRGAKDLRRGFRKFLSLLANIYLRWLLKINEVSDITSGYRGYSRDVLEKIDFESIPFVEGSAVLIEILRQAIKNGAQIKEVPIVYFKRLKGKSKFSFFTIKQSISAVFR